MGIIPAYAGSTKNMIMLCVCWSDHPRIRGEHGSTPSTPDESMGSSPHTRGARHLEVAVYPVKRIIPAYAGSTSKFRGVSFTWWDHPRIRGEHLARDIQVADKTGSSPHTRGARRHLHGVGDRPRIIPAYAGSTSCHIPSMFPPPDHPRIRGEHAEADGAKLEAEGSSPHTRGARQCGARRH